MIETSIFPDEKPVTLMLRDGDDQRPIDAQRGEALLFALRRAGVVLAAICGGKGACGTCRVHIAAGWHDRLAPPSKREARLLAHTKAAPGDRLSCQIPVEAKLEGLVLHPISDTKGQNDGNSDA